MAVKHCESANISICCNLLSLFLRKSLEALLQYRILLQYSYGKGKSSKEKSSYSRWSEVEIDALVTAVESNRKQILGLFSSEVTLNSKQNAWKIVAFKVSWCFSSSVLSRSLGFLHYIITVSLLRNIVLNLFDVKRVSRGL